MKRKVAIYTRVSTKEQLKQGYSIQQQADLLIKKQSKYFRMMNMKFIVMKVSLVRISKQDLE